MKDVSAVSKVFEVTNLTVSVAYFRRDDGSVVLISRSEVLFVGKSGLVRGATKQGFVATQVDVFLTVRSGSHQCMNKHHPIKY